MVRIDSFAPVVIPTLFRYDHFKLCIESLIGCTHAENTDVFIGLDYPAKDEHWVGYKKISDFLESLEKRLPFKSLNVIRRERNFGLGKNGNATRLIEDILKRYDSYIFSEDDNVFSPAFLDFINKGLQQYKNDHHIMAINGYSFFFNFRCADGDTVFLENYTFSAWGYGMWKDRYEEFKHMSSKMFRSKGIIRSSLWIAKEYGWERALRYITALNYPENKFPLTDYNYATYMILEKKFAVVPRISLVKNIGIDGSGENFKGVSSIIIDNYMSQSIYEETEYPIVKEGQDYFLINNKIYEHNSIDKISFAKFCSILTTAFVKKTMRTIRNVFRIEDNK